MSKLFFSNESLKCPGALFFFNSPHDNDSVIQMNQMSQARTVCGMDFTQSYCTTWNDAVRWNTVLSVLDIKELQCICESMFSHALIVKLQKQY